ncbi:MAG: hypothetical protein HPY71_15115 [Firmicutes bacterium]|nr:hypothetical protein [Bacillota bacterium]
MKAVRIFEQSPSWVRKSTRGNLHLRCRGYFLINPFMTEFTLFGFVFDFFATVGAFHLHTPSLEWQISAFTVFFISLLKMYRCLVSPIDRIHEKERAMAPDANEQGYYLRIS